MPRKPSKGSGVRDSGWHTGKERAELPCYCTGNRWRFPCGREASQLLQCVSILKFIFLELGWLKKIPQVREVIEAMPHTVRCLSVCAAMQY